MQVARSLGPQSFTKAVTTIATDVDLAWCASPTIPSGSAAHAVRLCERLATRSIKDVQDTRLPHELMIVRRRQGSQRGLLLNLMWEQTLGV